MVTAIVLAAGQSNRMGPVDKLFIPINGQAVVRHVVVALSALSLEEIIVVTRPELITTLENTLYDLAFRTIPNNTAHQGMATSIIAGVKGTRDETSAIMICLADMPWIALTTYKQLLAACVNHPDEIVRPIYAQRRGHPVIFPARLRPALLRLSGDTGARLLHTHHSVHDVGVNDPGICRDIDTPDDLAPLP